MCKKCKQKKCIIKCTHTIKITLDTAGFTTYSNYIPTNFGNGGNGGNGINNTYDTQFILFY